jgi:hypothetical protein
MNDLGTRLNSNDFGCDYNNFHKKIPNYGENTNLVLSS